MSVGEHTGIALGGSLGGVPLGRGVSPWGGGCPGAPIPPGSLQGGRFGVRGTCLGSVRGGASGDRSRGASGEGAWGAAPGVQGALGEEGGCMCPRPLQLGRAQTPGTQPWVGNLCCRSSLPPTPGRGCQAAVLLWPSLSRSRGTRGTSHSQARAEGPVGPPKAKPEQRHPWDHPRLSLSRGTHSQAGPEGLTGPSCCRQVRGAQGCLAGRAGACFASTGHAVAGGLAGPP